jgi:hypothetical protein
MPHWLRLSCRRCAAGCRCAAGKDRLIDLIAKGYGTLTWVFIADIVPLRTVGV